jgi:CelD/BcsL family acetyltransferase involved in cellulose biosynthesis
MSEAELVVEPEALEAIAPEWDALAVASDMPMASPAWMLGWWRHAAPPDAQLRVAVVRDREGLAGIAPFYVVPGARGRATDCRLLAGEFSSNVSLLARPGHEWDVAAACTGLLAETQPRPDLIALEPLPLASHWVAALRDHWPGPVRSLAFRYELNVSWTILLEGSSMEEWLAGRGSGLRRELRRRQRKFEALGGVARLSTPGTVDADIESFVALHAARWSTRGWSRLLALGDRLPLLLGELAGGLLEQGRFRLWILEIDGEPICADISIVAGREVVSLNRGWNERFANLSPAQLILLRKLEDCFERNDGRINLGWGENQAKLAFATGGEPIAWTLLLPWSRRLPSVLARNAPMLARNRLRQAAEHALTQEQMARLRSARRRVPFGIG